MQRDKSFEELGQASSPGGLENTLLSSLGTETQWPPVLNISYFFVQVLFFIGLHCDEHVERRKNRENAGKRSEKKGTKEKMGKLCDEYVHTRERAQKLCMTKQIGLEEADIKRRAPTLCKLEKAKKLMMMIIDCIGKTNSS